MLVPAKIITGINGPEMNTRLCSSAVSSSSPVLRSHGHYYGAQICMTASANVRSGEDKHVLIFVSLCNAYIQRTSD